MFKFLIKTVLIGMILKRFWFLALLLFAAKRFLPWEKDKSTAG